MSSAIRRPVDEEVVMANTGLLKERVAAMARVFLLSGGNPKTSWAPNVDLTRIIRDLSARTEKGMMRAIMDNTRMPSWVNVEVRLEFNRKYPVVVEIQPKDIRVIELDFLKALKWSDEALYGLARDLVDAVRHRSLPLMDFDSVYDICFMNYEEVMEDDSAEVELVEHAKAVAADYALYKELTDSGGFGKRSPKYKYNSIMMRYQVMKSALSKDQRKWFESGLELVKLGIGRENPLYEDVITDEDGDCCDLAYFMAFIWSWDQEGEEWHSMVNDMAMNASSIGYLYNIKDERNIANIRKTLENLSAMEDFWAASDQLSTGGWINAKGLAETRKAA